MLTNRRSFLAGAGVATGLSALPLHGLSAAAAAPLVEPDFGPKIGQALLSRNENPYGPAPSALRARHAVLARCVRPLPLPRARAHSRLVAAACALLRLPSRLLSLLLLEGGGAVLEATPTEGETESALE
jgi:histidinol-phosphate/aromatic aminotransferase/cobyric acid decarboxylase-like protein